MKIGNVPQATQVVIKLTYVSELMVVGSANDQIRFSLPRIADEKRYWQNGRERYSDREKQKHRKREKSFEDSKGERKRTKRCTYTHRERQKDIDRYEHA